MYFFTFDGPKLDADTLVKNAVIKICTGNERLLMMPRTYGQILNRKLLQTLKE